MNKEKVFMWVVGILLAVLLCASCTKEELVECYTTYDYVEVVIDGETLVIPKPKTICYE